MKMISMPKLVTQSFLFLFILVPGPGVLLVHEVIGDELNGV